MSAERLTQLPKLGLGVGLRSNHFHHITSHWPQVDWFEAISENFMDSGGRPGYILRQIAERYPVVLHGVSMSIGSSEPVNRAYVQKLKRLADEVSAVWVSDHLCWTGTLGINSHDLLPIPLNEAMLAHVSQRVNQIQDELERPLILENPSTYIGFADSQMEEPEFLKELVRRTGCGLLLDVNNVFVSCFNAGCDPVDYLQRFPYEVVVQLHLAGHQHCGTHIVDTHDHPVSAAVWELFRFAWQRSNGASTLLEWDGDVPEFDVVHAEVLRAKEFMQGDIILEQLNPETRATENALSNPLDFIVEDVRASGHYKNL